MNLRASPQLEYWDIGMVERWVKRGHGIGDCHERIHNFNSLYKFGDVE
jgi:hypothetical protein